ncbi:MAG: right-handed parallel beta-helix repeat-containing protein, partial [Candidatus Atribacteria bacterium]
PQWWATGDGTVENPWANDCIQKAYDFVPDGGTIFLKAGYYTLATTLTIAKKINIIGEGRNKSIIVLDIADDNGIETASTADYCTLKGFTIDGDAQTDGTQYLSPILISNCDYVLLEDIEAKNAGYYGINIYQVNHSLFQNIYAHDNYRHGLHPGSDKTGRNKYNVYRDIYAWNNGVDGFSDRGNGINPDEECHNIYDGIVCWDNGRFGIEIDRQRYGVLSNSSVSENGKYGIYLTSLGDFEIHDCSVTLSGEEGLDIKNSNNINFTNVIVKNNNVSDTDYIGGVKIENSSGIKFTSCQSYDDRTPMLQEYGIRTVGDVDFVEIINCILTPNEKGTILNHDNAIIISGDG